MFRATIAGILLFAATPVIAQQQPTVVQLPSFSFFTVSTTVSVPDSGRGFLGGVKNGQIGSVSRGSPLLSKVPWMKRLFTNRGIGRAVNHAGASVTARIIDLNEMEEDLMRGAGPRRPSLGGPELSAAKRSKALFLTRNIVKGTKRGEELVLSGSLAAIRNKLKAEDRAKRLVKHREGLRFFQQAQRAEADGRKGAAKVLYRMAAKRSGGKLKKDALERLAILASPKRSAKVVAK